MNKKTIVEEVATAISYLSQSEDIINAIYEAMEDWENASAYFEVVSDPKLVDYAIYLEAAAKSRYTYLIGEARKKGIVGDYSHIIKKISGI